MHLIFIMWQRIKTRKIVVLLLNRFSFVLRSSFVKQSKNERRNATMSKSCMMLRAHQTSSTGELKLRNMTFMQH